MIKTISNMDYYYNQSPGQNLWRNNLIYTSLISPDKKVFCQWYFNDGVYHKNQNQVVDPSLMQEKWEREVKYLLNMSKTYPDLVPNILDINYKDRKIFLEIDGVDFWQRSLDKNNCSFDEILPDWKDQMLNIVHAHRSIGYYKYSMHPSSYFIVNNKLKSINYFFTYNKNEGPIKISDHLSHIYSTRQEEMKKYTDSLGIDWDTPQPLEILEQLCWDSFRSNYPIDFIEKVKCI
jgi:hypothetical protein